MPTYEYKCEACGHTFEKFQPMSSAAVRKCPSCGKNKVKRLIGTGAGLIFKGSGFYITDYRSEAYKNSAKGDQPAAASATADASKPAESKPADGKAAEAKPPETKPATKAEVKSTAEKSKSKGKDKS
jgi:putative FmdB family regulatory protein